MLYVDRDEVKHLAIEHWKENLRNTIEMDWEDFMKRRAKTSIYSLLNGQIPGYPKIFGDHCSYCAYMKEHSDAFDWEHMLCEGCPLNDDVHEAECSTTWVNVREAFEQADFQSEAIEACAKMLRKIEENGDQWRW